MFRPLDIALSRLENAPKPDDVQAIEKVLQARVRYRWPRNGLGSASLNRERRRGRSCTVTRQIEAMIQTVTAQWQGAHPNHAGPVPLPLVRLKVRDGAPALGRRSRPW